MDLKGLVLDLRGNPGGLLDAAVEIASYLVPSKSDIVSAKSRNGEEVIYRSVIDPIRPFGMKLAVMVSKVEIEEEGEVEIKEEDEMTEWVRVC